MDAESHSNIQLADLAKVKAELLSGPLTLAEQARRLIVFRDVATTNEQLWSGLLEGLPQELLDTVTGFQQDGQQGKLCSACPDANCHTVLRYCLALRDFHLEGTEA